MSLTVTPVQVSGSNLAAAEAVTPSDAADLPLVATRGAACAIYVGVTGSVVVTTPGARQRRPRLRAPRRPQGGHPQGATRCRSRRRGTS